MISCAVQTTRLPTCLGRVLLQHNYFRRCGPSEHETNKCLMCAAYCGMTPVAAPSNKIGTFGRVTTPDRGCTEDRARLLARSQRKELNPVLKCVLVRALPRSTVPKKKESRKLFFRPKKNGKKKWVWGRKALGSAGDKLLHFFNLFARKTDVF